MTYTQEYIHDVTERQRAFFRTGQTLDVSWRIEQLKKLKQAVLDRQEALQAALYEDLGKSPAEAWLCDIGPLLLEIDETLRGVRRWARPESRFSGLTCFPSTRTTVYKMPYGVTLIISPFNFPVLLSLGVLIAAIAGGNTAVLKASSKSPASTRALQELIADTFPEEYITVIGGGHDAADLCLAERFDKIFYTGSPAVGRHILEMAAKNLTPVALELGGETGNWAVVRRDADLKDAARKIAFMKLCNAGQVCININQVAVAKEVAREFLAELRAAFTKQIGEKPETNPEYPKLISPAVYDKCERLTEQYRDRLIFGGTGDRAACRFAPTVFYPVDADEEIVQHELFCPLLPVVPFADADIDDLMTLIASREHPLALYIFTKDLKWARRTMSSQQYGGGCINEVCMHMMVKGVPFNGTGHSGMGAYHGEWGFREFTHPSTVLTGRTRGNMSLREHPYTKRKLKFLKMFEK
ncbi:MAG: aldehyde dehydrogenase family protein [Lachnospiraceae bacterium]|nr:aldehyde dehydrogenase family protein [Lachnospiraceae bacterium]